MARWLPHIPTNNAMAREWASRLTTTESRHCATPAMPRLTKAMNGARTPSLRLGMKPTEEPLDGYSSGVTLHYIRPEGIDVGSDGVLSLVDSQESFPLGISIHLRATDQDLHLTELFHGLL